MKTLVIDVSTWQGKIDWEKVKPQIGGAILRCGYGTDREEYDDAQFKRNADECTRLGIPFGVYLYSYAKTVEQAKSEAAHVLRLIKPYKLSYPVYLDLEEADSVAGIIERANAFGDIIEKAGYWCGVYSSKSWWETHLKGLERFTKWVAQWYKECTYTGSNVDMWQYSDKGKIHGIEGHVDMNECYRDFPTLIQGKAPAEPVKKSIDEIAKEVIAGRWGSGADRKKRLEAERYNYNEVQARVNEMLRGESKPAKKSVDEIAREVIAGKWGRGADRKKKLAADGYDPNEIQKRVNELMKG